MPSGYKVYYNGEKFVVDEHKTTLTREDYPRLDNLTCWCRTKEHAEQAAEFCNGNLLPNIIILKCRDCGRYFHLSREEYDFYNKMYFVKINHCRACRTKKLNDKILSIFKSKLHEFDLDGIEITEEDIKRVRMLYSYQCDTLDEAVNEVLQDIKDLLEESIVDRMLEDD